MRATGSADGAGPSPIPPLHLITDDRILAEERFPARARSVMEAGGERVALHLRGPRTTGRRLYDLALLLREEAARTGAWLVVNDRVDIARMSGATGVQLGARGMEIGDARALLGREARIGASVHHAEEAVRAGAAGADFLLVGTLFETASHPGRRGRFEVLEGCAAADLPMVGIGGITPARTGRVREAGARGVAVIRGVWEAPEPAAAVEDYLSEWGSDG